MMLKLLCRAILLPLPALQPFSPRKGEAQSNNNHFHSNHSLHLYQIFFLERVRCGELFFPFKF